MSVKNSMDRTMTAFQEGKTKMVKLYDFIGGLSVKNKMNFDIQLKSDKCFAPLCRHSFGYNKEFRVMPVILCTVGAAVLCAALKIAKMTDR